MTRATKKRNTGRGLPAMWRRFGWYANPLARSVDRAQGAGLLVLLLLGLAVLPVAAVVGEQTYYRQLNIADAQVSVTAVLTETPQTTAATAGVRVQPVALATWRMPDGSQHSGYVLTQAGQATGDSVPLRVDRRGNPVALPETPRDAWWAGVLTSVSVTLGAATALAALYLLLVAGLNRRRYADWDREWREVGPRWTHPRSR